MQPINIAPLAIWTKKFALPFARIINTSLQKITATDRGELLLSVYKPNDDRSLVVLSMKKGESGISLLHARPVAQKQPNSFVQIARKYIQGRKIAFAYATISPICIVIEFAPFSAERINEDKSLVESPDALVLDLDAKPPRLILAKKSLGVLKRYQEECGQNFSSQDVFFESWCEWSEESTKTKRRAAFLLPMVGYCPLEARDFNISSGDFNLSFPRKRESISTMDSLVKPGNDKTPLIRPSQNDNICDDNINSALDRLPGHVRKACRTRIQFLERRLLRQKNDLPTEHEIARLTKQTEGLKTYLYLWPKDSLTWYVPPQFIEKYGLNAIYIIKKGEKSSNVLTNTFRQIEILERRRQELTKRIVESEKSLEQFTDLVIKTAQNLKTDASYLQRLCKILDIETTQTEQLKKIKKEKEARLPFRQYVASSGHFIRVARSAADGELMLKLMPSNHYWCHILSGEGSHVWLEKAKGEKKAPPTAIREAGMLAVHHSKYSRAHAGEVQFATRADIEKKKNLPVGKVLVRRCETFMIRYEDHELKKIIEG